MELELTRQGVCKAVWWEGAGCIQESEKPVQLRAGGEGRTSRAW